MPVAKDLEGLPLVTPPPPVTSDREHAARQGGCRDREGHSADLVTNLLPTANDSLTVMAEGVYVGEGVPPVPAKLASKIRRGEFVDMGELLPEFWGGAREEDGEARREQKARRSRKVTDIFTWIQCYGTYVAVRATGAPEMIPEMMAYQTTIARVSQDYAGLAWMRYDAAFRRQAALTGNTHWSTVNTTLYTMCFTGKTTVGTRCELCFATSHTERECAQRGDPEPDTKDRLKAIESAVLALVPQAQKPRPPVTVSGDCCQKWNQKRCFYRGCRFLHKCSGCRGDHPVVECPTRPGPSGTGWQKGRQVPPRQFQPYQQHHPTQQNRPY
jgi:hypothetical protein